MILKAIKDTEIPGELISPFILREDNQYVSSFMRCLVNDIQGSDLTKHSMNIKDSITTIVLNYSYCKDMLISKYFEPMWQETKPKIL